MMRDGSGGWGIPFPGSHGFLRSWKALVSLLVLILATMIPNGSVLGGSLSDLQPARLRPPNEQGGKEASLGAGLAAAGPVYFVAKDGSDSNPGTEEEPWLTIQHAAEMLEAGDTVYIKAGAYRERVLPQNSGSEGAFVHFAAYPGHEGQVVIDGTGLSFSGGGLVSIRQASFIQISHLRVENSDDAAIHVFGSDHIIIEGNQTKDSHSSGIGIWSSSNVVVEDNTVVNARNVPTEQGGHEECISISNTDTFEVFDNEVYYADESRSYLGGAGIDIKEGSANGRIYGNYVHNIPHDAGIYIDAWNAHNHDHLVFQNLIRDAGGISVGSERGGTAENITIHDNVVIRSGWTGIIISNTGEGSGGNGPRRNIRIVNNTIYEAKGNGGAGIYVVSENIADILIKNNIVSFGWGIYGPNGWESGWVGQITAATVNILGKVTAEKNLTFGPERCSQDFPECRQIPGSIQSDPLFRDRPNEDLHLQAGSAAVDTGGDLRAEGVAVDFDGVSRPQGSGFDIGAFEYVDSSPIFADVPPDHAYYEEIEALYLAGYTAGCNAVPLRYCPDATMNRAESAVFVERGIHSASFEPAPPVSQVFADLPLDSWAAGWVDSLWDDGFTAGCGTNPLLYCPWQGHSRAEAAVFYLRMLRGADYTPAQPTSPLFADVPTDSWYAGWVHEAYNAGLIEPCEVSPQRRYCPDAPLTRAVAAYMMARAKGLMPPPAADWWRPVPGVTWQWQITGKVEETVEPAQMFDIDLTDAMPSDREVTVAGFGTVTWPKGINAGIIDRLHARGKVVICYLDSGAFEAYEPDAGLFPASVIGNNTGWNGENWLDIRRPSWPAFAPLIWARFQLAHDIGCDGVEPDQNNPLGNNPGFPITQADQKAWYLEVSSQAHARGLSVGMKNGIETTDSETVAAFDWNLNEECFQYDECDALTPFITAGKAVFQTEYTGSTAAFCPEANRRGFSSMKKRLELDAWREICFTFPVAPSSP